MKEVKTWNGKKREMWVWDDFNECRRKAMVIGIKKKPKDDEFRVQTINDYNLIIGYDHCAEIEEDE